MCLVEGWKKVSLLHCASLKDKYYPGLLTEIISVVFGIIGNSLQIRVLGSSRFPILLIENINVHSLSKVQFITFRFNFYAN